MATEPAEKDPHSIPKIRTFAADLEAVRRSRGDENETEEERALKPKPKEKKPAEEKQEKKDHKHTPAGVKSEPKKEGREPEPKKDQSKPKIIDAKKGTANPPFHEIAKRKKIRVDVDEADIEASKADGRESLLEDKSKTVSIGGKGRSGVDSGTVVTDTKRKRFKLIPSIFRSIADWLEDFKNKYITPKPPKYTVSGSYRTRGVIRDDTVKSGKSHVDHDTVIKRIKQRRSEGEEDDETDEDEAKEYKPLLLEAPEDEDTTAALVQPRTNVATEERKSAATARAKELEAKEAELKKREEALKAAEAEAKRLKEEAESAATKSKEEAAKSKEEAAAEAERLRQEAAEAVAEAEARREAAANEVTDAQMRAAAAAILAGQGTGADQEEEQRSLKDQLRDTNVATLLAVVGIACLAILYVAGSSLYSTFFAPEEIVAPGISVPALISGEQIQLALSGPELRQDIISTIDEAPARAIQIDLISQSGQEPALAEPVRVAAQLGWRADPAFLTSIRQVAIGGFDRMYPFVILRTTDYETALGGMLTWENTMAQDLSIFRSSYSGSAEASGFADATIGGIDARESTAAVENQIVWGFVDDTTILIAPNRQVFANLLPLINP